MKRIYKICFTLLLLIIGILSSQKFLKKYQTYSKLCSYFNNPSYNYDVFFLGTSHVLNGVFPMDLWHDYGITSYNFAWHSTPIATNYYLLKMIAKNNKPKIVFIDILQLQEDKKYNVYMHQLFDYFPLESNKIAAINDFFPGKHNLTKKIEFYFPFIYCHSTWLDIKANNFYKEIPTKGADFRIGIKMPQEFDLSVPEYNGQKSCGFEYAEKIVEYCKENNIIPVFYLIPYPEMHNLDGWKKAFCDFLDNQNIRFMEFPENIVDYDTDMYDINSHLNPSGAKKVTKFIGEYINRNFDSLGVKSESDIKSWNDDYSKYIDYSITKLNEQDEMNNYLMMLYNNDYYSEINIGKDNQLNDLSNKLIDQIPYKKIIFSNNNEINIKVFNLNNDKLISEKKF